MNPARFFCIRFDQKSLSCLPYVTWHCRNFHDSDMKPFPHLSRWEKEVTTAGMQPTPRASTRRRKCRCSLTARLVVRCKTLFASHHHPPQDHHSVFVFVSSTTLSVLFPHLRLSHTHLRREKIQIISQDERRRYQKGNPFFEPRQT